MHSMLRLLLPGLLALTLVACVPTGGGSSDDPDAAPSMRDTGPAVVLDSSTDPPADGGAAEDGGPVSDADAPDSGAPDMALPDMAPPAACANGVDDDGDGRVDLDDRGCSDADDDNEGDEIALPGCDDAEDNDGDGRVDAADPDCSSPADPREDGIDGSAGCFDGLDNDGDGWVDFPYDPGCVAAGDDDETDPLEVGCADGVDNDDDGLTDWPEDPGCAGRGDRNEADPVFAPGCADGEDNDADEATDWPTDPGCEGAGDFDEVGPCGVDTIDLNAAGLDYQGTTAGLEGRFVGSCGGNAGGEGVFVYRPTETLERVVFSTAHPETERPTVLFIRRNCGVAEELGCDRGNEGNPGTAIAIDEPGPGPYFIFVDSGSRDPGAYRLTVEEVPVPACRNGRDDDEDGFIDNADPGCVESEDRDEADPPEPPACSNGLDDDGDGDVDYPADGDCEFAGGVLEAPLCPEGVEVLRVPVMGGDVVLPRLDGRGATTGSCEAAAFTAEVALRIELPVAADVRVEVLVDGQPAVASRYARRICTDAESEFACRANADDRPIELLEERPGEFFVFIEQGFVGAEERIARVTIDPLVGDCNDEIDNDGDGLVDLADPGCERLRDQSEADPPEVPDCSNGIDDDEDGLTDWPEDDGCVAAGDPREGGCVGNPQWRPAECVTAAWVWTNNRAFQDLQAANANRTLYSGCNHAGDNPVGLCSLDGTGWVSTETFVMAGCNASWSHIGGRFSGNCGGHDGDTVRLHVLGEDDCYDY